MIHPQQADDQLSLDNQKAVINFQVSSQPILSLSLAWCRVWGLLIVSLEERRNNR
jgi:hypothetical protein